LKKRGFSIVYSLKVFSFIIKRDYLQFSIYVVTDILEITKSRGDVKETKEFVSLLFNIICLLLVINNQITQGVKEIKGFISSLFISLNI
jgi:hypothetical protein